MRSALVVLALVVAPPLLGQQSVTVPTAVGVTQPVLTGLLETPVVTRQRVKGTTVTGLTTARVRSNVPWTLRVSLAAPVNPTLTATFEFGKNKKVELSATRPSATVTTGTTPCAACVVALEWEFSYKVSGRTKFTPTVPALLFEATPTVRP